MPEFIMAKANKHTRSGQVTLEFTFALVIITLLALGMIWVFQWAGNDIAQRKKIYEQKFVDPSSFQEPFYTSTDIRAAVNSNIFGN
jgi:hypothetical protein